MERQPPRSTRTDPLVPYTPLFRSGGPVLPTRGGRARDRTERPVPVHDLLSRLERRVAFEQRQPALGLAEEMRARDDLLARVAALLHAVGVQAFERELLRRPFLDLRLRKSRQAMGKVERRPAQIGRAHV